MKLCKYFLRYYHIHKVVGPWPSFKGKKKRFYKGQHQTLSRIWSGEHPCRVVSKVLHKGYWTCLSLWCGNDPVEFWSDAAMSWSAIMFTRQFDLDLVSKVNSEHDWYFLCKKHPCSRVVMQAIYDALSHSQRASMHRWTFGGGGGQKGKDHCYPWCGYLDQIFPQVAILMWHIWKGQYLWLPCKWQTSDRHKITVYLWLWHQV